MSASRLADWFDEIRARRDELARERGPTVIRIHRPQSPFGRCGSAARDPLTMLAGQGRRCSPRRRLPLPSRGGGGGAGVILERFGGRDGGVSLGPTRATIAKRPTFVRVQEFSELRHDSLSRTTNRNPVEFRMALHASEINSGTGMCLYRNKGKRTWPHLIRIKSSSVRFGRGMPQRTLRALCACRSRLPDIGPRLKLMSDDVPSSLSDY
jgi:hypothetical protein